MAADFDQITERTRSGWNGFATFLGLASAGIAIALLLMAAFLL